MATRLSRLHVLRTFQASNELSATLSLARIKDIDILRLVIMRYESGSYSAIEGKVVKNNVGIFNAYTAS